MTGDEPPYLAVGTEVSAKYRGAFCEAKVKKLVRSVKCKVILKDSQISMMVTDDQLKGILKIGEVVELKDPDSGQMVNGTIHKMTDSSMYTVVFNDGDERTLRRTQLCLKGEKHFIESETLDNLPLSHPEHFGTPVMHGKKSKRGRYSGGGTEDELDETSSEDGASKRASYKGRLKDLVGKVMILDFGDKRKLQVPVLVVLPDAQPPDPKKKDHILVKSFKDGKFVHAQRKELKEFARDVALKSEDKALKAAFEKTLMYYDTQDLPTEWDHDELLGTDDDEDFNEEESSDDEPNEEKDCFVAQLYKFMDDRGTPINKAPAIVNKDLNLYRLFKVVQHIGGYNKVTNQMKWRMVYSKMNLPPINTASHQIKNAYKKYLHAFEDFYRKLGSSMGTISRPGRSRHNSGRGMVQFRGKDKHEDKDSESVSEEVKDEKPKEEEVSPTKDRQTPKRVTRQDVSEESGKKESQTDAKKAVKKEEPDDSKKKTNKKEENESKKEIETKKNQKKEEVDVKKGKEEEAKKGKDDNEAKKDKDEKTIKKEDEKKAKKEENGNKKAAKNEDSKKEKKEENMKKAKVVLKKEKDDTTKVKKESETEVTEKKTASQTADKKTAQPAEKKTASQAADKKAAQQTPDKKVTNQTNEKKTSQQTGDKKVSQPPGDKKVATTPKTSDGDDKPKTSPKKIVRRRSMRKDEVKEETSATASAKLVMQKEVKVNLIKKDFKPAEVIKRIKKPKVEGQTDEKDKKSVSQKDTHNCPMGSRLKVRYGGGQTQKIYDAKVVEAKDDGSGLQYLVHYAGWNNRYDEWIQPERIVSIVEKPASDLVVKKMEKKFKDVSSPKTPKLSPAQPVLTPQQQVMKKRARSGPTESPSSSPARSEKARSPASSVVGSDKKKSRPTRSNSVEFKCLEGLQVKHKRTRRNSGVTESSDIISHASFTDDTDNSDEETDKAEEMESSDCQSITEPSKPVISDSESKTKEETKLDENEEKGSVDIVEVKVMYGGDSPVNVETEDCDINKNEDSDEIDVPKIESEIAVQSEDQKPSEMISKDITESVDTTEQEVTENKMPEIPEVKNVPLVEVVTEILERKPDCKEEEVVKKDEEQEEQSVDIKCNEDSSSLDRYEFKDEEEEISLPEWKAERHVEEDWKPRERGRPRKAQCKDKIEPKKEQPTREKKEVKKTKMTMAERKYMGQNPPSMADLEPPVKKMKEEEIVEKTEVKDTNDEDTEEDNEMEKKKVKKKTKKKETFDSDGSDIDHKKVKTSNKPVTKSKKRLKDADDLDRRSLMSDDDSSVASEKCDTDNPSVSSEVYSNTVININESKTSAETIEISEQTDTATTGAFENTPPTSPEQETNTCVIQSQDHSHDSHKNIVAMSTEQHQYESQAGNTSPSSSNEGSVGSGNVAGSDSSDAVNIGKRKKESEEVTPAKKRRRGKSKSNGEKKSKPNGSDSDESYNQTSGSSSPTKSRPRSPRTPKYNLNLEEGKYLEGEERITFLMEKAQEIRKIYMDLKAEVATIDRRRKRAKRKDRESYHGADQEHV
ncbi:AT-rich interactive domain-containing protein 4B-like [Mytilus californianus]|uniref:AT-rich interactive domain-containing protein 4B-like n=1 Tax=Mytilus californianus TaxID=6549 RepID=UPI00224775CE|nr:AT-rich interactive domain-containing protein 4B-like [Mytilus californianus]